MKYFLSFLSFLGLLVLVGGVAAVIYWKEEHPDQPEEEEAPVATEVAVHTGKISRATLHGYVVAYGSIELAPAVESIPAAGSRVCAPMAGIVTEIKCVEGQRVAKGTMLFHLDSRAADLAIQKAKQAVEFAEKNLQRQKKLQESEGTSAKLYQEAEYQLTTARHELTAAQTQRSLLDIEAPMSGIVTQLLVRPGESIEANKVLAGLDDLSRLVAVAAIPLAELSRVKIEMPAFIGAPGSMAQNSGAATESLVLGKVAFIGLAADAKTDTVPVRIALPESSGLRPGQFVMIRITYEERPNRLVVPEESVVTDQDGASVIAIVEGDKATKRIVKTGLREGTLVEVEGEGLSEGVTVVTEGAYGLPKETKIRVIKP